MDWEEREGNSNPFVPNEIVKHIHATLKEFKASEQSPAMLARGNPMNPARGANEDWEFKASEQSPAVLARGTPMNPAGEAYESWARKPPTPS